MKKVTSSIIAVVLISFAVLSFEWTRNLVFSRGLPQTIIQAILIGLALGLGISRKILGVLPIIIAEAIIYWSVTWTSWPVSIWITRRIAPVLGVIAAIIIVIQNINDGKDSDN